MNVDEALRKFAEDDDLPGEAMTWALDNWEAASPRFIARLRAFAAGGDRTEAAEDQLFYILHLCGQRRETRAYEPICRLIAGDPDIEVWLGDATTETLSGILINVFDGDVAPLTAAIESPGGDEFARGSALSALGYLVRSRGAVSDEAMRALLRRLRGDALPRDIPSFWFSWAATAAALGYEDLKMEVAILTKDGLLDASDLDLEDFNHILDLARADPSGLAGFHDQSVLPLDDAIGTLESWRRGGDLDFDEEGFESSEDDNVRRPNPFDAPYVNLVRDVGRNDPCPCGSGKKYKKCCLAS
jgi:Protein of unknown function (DUF1186)/SEC-C motif